MKKESKNSLLGVIGAILFALIGAIPFIALYVYCNIRWSFLAYFIGVCSYLGYRLFKGKHDNKVIVKTGIVTLVVTLLAILFIIPSLLIVNKNMGPISDVLPILYDDIDFVKVIIKDTIVALIFAGFSIYTVYKRITPKEVVVEGEELEEEKPIKKVKKVTKKK